MEAQNSQTIVQPPPNAVTSQSPKANSRTYSLSERVEAEKTLERARERARGIQSARAAADQPISLKLPPAAAAFTTDAEIERQKLAGKQATCKGQANIPPRYKGADLLNLEQVPEQLRAERYGPIVDRLHGMLERAEIIALLGNRGAGKTWMACGLVREFCRRGRSAVYLEAMDFFIALQETYGDGSKANPSDVEKRYIAPELLVLDAMEERGETAWSDRMLNRLINKRYAAIKSTLLISNETEAVFSARVGESIVDRIRDSGGQIVCEWESLRGRIGAAS